MFDVPESRNRKGGRARQVRLFVPTHTVTYLGDLPSSTTGISTGAISKDTRKRSNRKISRDIIKVQCSTYGTRGSWWLLLWRRGLHLRLYIDIQRKVVKVKTLFSSVQSSCSPIYVWTTYLPPNKMMWDYNDATKGFWVELRSCGC